MVFQCCPQHGGGGVRGGYNSPNITQMYYAFLKSTWKELQSNYKWKHSFSFLQKGDGLGVFNFVTKHHWKASNFVTPLQMDTTTVKSKCFDTFLLFKILDEFFMGIAVLYVVSL